MAIDAGVDSIEHGFSVRPEQARRMAAAGIYLCPMLMPTDFVAEVRARERSPLWAHAFPTQARSLVNCLDAGVKVLFGTDAGTAPWTDVNETEEFSYEVRCGMSVADALRSATSLAADFLNVGHDLGTLEVGKKADLVAVPGDPLASIELMGSVDFVMKDGAVHRGPTAG